MRTQMWAGLAALAVGLGAMAVALTQAGASGVTESVTVPNQAPFVVSVPVR